MKNGIRVHITGHSDVADTVEFMIQSADKAGAADDHRPTGNSLFHPTADTQKVLPILTWDLPSKRRAIWTEQCPITIRPSSSIRKIPALTTTEEMPKIAKGDLNGAITDYNQAIKINPKICLRI
jgi:hypothetical protein